MPSCFQSQKSGTKAIFQRGVLEPKFIKKHNAVTAVKFTPTYVDDNIRPCLHRKLGNPLELISLLPPSEITCVSGRVFIVMNQITIYSGADACLKLQTEISFLCQ